LSFARTAKLLVDAGQVPQQAALREEDINDQGLVVEQTAWGQAHRLLAPLSISGTPLQWICRRWNWARTGRNGD
jgi:hypothetical protein